MGRKRSNDPPLKLHRSGSYYVNIDGGRAYLGPDQAKAEEARRRLLAERLLRGGKTETPDPIRAGGLTVSEVCERCGLHARDYYAPSHFSRVKQSLLVLDQLYGSEPADTFDQVRLLAVQKHLLTRPHERKPGQVLARNTVNRMIGVIQTLWGWAAVQGLVPAEKAKALTLLRSIRKGKGGRETPKVTSVAPETVERTLPLLGGVVRAMVQLQQATGMRPGEVCRMRRGELSLTPTEKLRTTEGVEVSALQVDGEMIWVYVPEHHKTEHVEKSRIVVLGPAAQAVLHPFLGRPAEAYLFSPAEALTEWRARQRSARKSKVQPSQQSRARRSPKRKPGARYAVSSYDQAIARAVERHNGHLKDGEKPIPHWSPNQLRHHAGTEISQAFDQHAAQAVLGHSRPDTTATYIDSHLKKAAEVARRMG